HFMAEARFHCREPPQTLTQYAFEVGLVHIVVAGPIVWADAVKASPDKQRLSRRRDEMHTLRRRTRNLCNRVGEACGLEGPHDLAVEVNGARQLIDVEFAIDQQDAE